MDEWLDVAAEVRRRMRELGYTPKDVADRTGLPPWTIANLHACIPAVKNLPSLNAALELPPGWLSAVLSAGREPK